MTSETPPAFFLSGTIVTDGTLLKVYSWYDNEVGYSCRMVDLADLVVKAGA